MLIHKIKNKVVVHEKDGKVIVYIDIKIEGKTLFDIQHKLRFKSIIFGCIVHAYNPEMNFSNALKAGWKETFVKINNHGGKDRF